MQSLADEKIGDAIIRIVSNGGLYQGRVLRESKPGQILEDTDLNLLRARLRNEAGKLHPNYVGVDGAIDRFLHFFPGGFEDVAFVQDERDYKVKAQDKLDVVLPLSVALDASAEQAVKVRAAFSTNILHSTELARAHELLGSQDGPAYVRSAARFASGELAAGLAGMAAAIAPHGRHSWPLFTYLPNLWRPLEHMFLKPAATVDFAERIGHDFQYDYSATPEASVYEALLDLAGFTESSIAALKPRDRIDVQSFIWVVGDYTEKELPRLEMLRAQA